MAGFELDSRLARDCIVLGRLDISQLLLMNNALVPWFILVPVTTETEIVDLSAQDQARLLQEINLISVFIREHFNITKLNTAAIGNVVSQLHIHVVGRDPADYCWPDVVWGRQERRAYSDEELHKISGAIKAQLLS
jgi:diadenosine tetraphosphate (Ap4A) HIT family hydrolase